MLFRMLNRFRPDPLRAQVEETIQAGTGLRKGEWLLPGGAQEQSDVDALADAIVDWCREQMRTARTPYGIDQMALAVACAVPGGEPGRLGDLRRVPSGRLPPGGRDIDACLGLRARTAVR